MPNYQTFWHGSVQLITLQNPVGLYFDSFSPSGFVTPDRTDAAQFWTWTRGQEGYRLRGVFEVPAGKPYKVGDISIQGKGKIRYGSMLVDYIRIKLVGLACNIDRANRKPVSTLHDMQATRHFQVYASLCSCAVHQVQDVYIAFCFQQ